MKQFLKIVFGSMIGFILANIVMFFISLFMLGIIVAAVGGSSKADNELEVAEEQILKIDLTGTIVERLKHRDIHFSDDVPIFGENQPLSLRHIQKVLTDAAEDEKIKGVYIKAGLVQTGWATLSALRQLLLDFKESGKFIYAYSDIYTEANYYISSVSDVVFVYPEGYLEHDGFASVPSFFKKTLEKLEIEPLIFRAGSFKSAVEPFMREDLSEENRLQITELVEGFWQIYLENIGKSRKLTPERLDQLAEQRLVSSAKEAKEHGLVDELKFEDEVLSFLRGAIGIEEDKDLPFVSIRNYYTKKKAANPALLLEMAAKEVDEDSKGDTIAIVFAEGEIVGGKSRDDMMGAETIVKAIRKARKDENVKAMVLRVNSPGGSALASDEIWREVSLAREKMPVIASFSDVAASGGYYIAAPANEIFAEANTLTGSIGVFGLSLMMKNFFENKLGVTFDRVVSNRFADLGSAARPIEDEERAQIDKEVARVYERFLTLVEGGRKMSREELVKVAEGRVWTGVAAKEQGLVDQIGGLQAAIDRAAELAEIKEFDELELPRPESPIKFVFEMISAKVEESLFAETKMMNEMRKAVALPKDQDPRGVYMIWPFRLNIK